MDDLFFGYFGQSEVAIAHMKKVVDLNGDFYGGIRSRCILAKQENGSWMNAICVFEAFPKKAVPKKKKNQKYDKYNLLETWFTKEEFFRVLDQLKDKKIFFGDCEVPVDGCETIQSHEFRPGKNEGFNNPLHSYMSSRRNNPPYSREPIISYEQSVYPNLFAAISDWTGILSTTDMDGRVGAILYFLPECRAWIKRISCSGTKINIEVQTMKTDIQGLRIKGVWEEAGGFSQFSSEVNRKKILIKAPKKAKAVDFYLIDKNENIYDYHKETTSWSQGRLAILPLLKPKDSSQEQVIRNALEAGEGERIEYKSRISQSDAKQLEEIIETVIAFANTKGGMILIGVDDHCVVNGVEHFISPNPQTLHKKLSEYCVEVRQAIANGLNQELEIHIGSYKIDGHWIVVINVPLGINKPYQRREKNLIFIRRVGSNKKATVDEIKDMIAESSPVKGPYEELLGAG